MTYLKIAISNNITESVEKYYAFGIGSIYLMSTLYISTWIGLLVDLNPGLISILTAISLTIYLIKFLDCSAIVKYGWGLIAPCAFLFVAVFINCYVWDVSPDGLAYHQTAVLYQNAGWNPLKSNLPYSQLSVWINSYPKASWLVGASLSGIFKSVEAMKAQNMIFFASSCPLVFSGIRYSFPNLDNKKSVLTAAAISLNPVIVCQLFTSYNDGLLASQITCLVTLAILSFSKKSISAIYGLVLLIPYTLNLKFTAVPYLAVLWIGLLGLLILMRRRDAIRFLAIPELISCLIGVFIFGFNPYVLNLIEHGHPFYPIMGINKIDFMQANTPSGLINSGYWYRLLAGIFAIPDSSHYGAVQFFFPLFPRLYYFTRFTIPDMSIGGFGPLFGLATICSVFGVLLIRNTVPNQKIALLIAAAVILSGLINPQSWWARYVPQFWLGICLIAIALMDSSRLIIRRYGLIIILLMTCNSLGISAIAFTSAIVDSNYWKTSLTSIADKSRQGKALRVYFGYQQAAVDRFDKFNVNYFFVKELSECEKGGVAPLFEKPKTYLSSARICLD